MINAVVFDMDGVLCRYRIERRLTLLASWSGQSPETIHAAIWGSGFEDEAERGVVSADEYLRGFGERMGYALSAAQWVEARRAAIEPDLAVLAIARQLSTSHPVGMFTNNPLLLKRAAVETSKGYFVVTYPDTEIGVAQFLDAIRPALETEPGRFYPCVAYDGPVRDIVQSPFAKRIGVVESLRTGLRDPGMADAPWFVRGDRITTYLASQPTKKLDVKLVEKMCLSLLPRNYMDLYPAKAGVREFYR